MPKARVNGIDLYYQKSGSGPNLTLIEGLGYHAWMWYRQLPTFSQHFQTLVYDNRGVGQSDKPPGPYDHQENARDLIGLLDLLGWDRTHVLGVSMGGFIAQEFALAHPDRLDRLVLIATAFGGPNMVSIPAAAVRALLPDPTLSPEQKIRQSMPVGFGDSSWPDRHAAEFEQIVRWRLECPQPPEATLAQAAAGVTFNVEPRLAEITAPTLVIAGTQDHVVPVRNAELLANAIPGAQLDLISGAGHLVFIEEAEQVNQAVITFLTREKQTASLESG